MENNLIQKSFVADIEATGLLDKVEKPEDLHVFSISYLDGTYKIKSTTSTEDIKAVMSSPDNIVVGHNFFLYDVPALEKMLGIEVKATIIDSLFTSWYIEPSRNRHGLEKYGEEMGVPKPEIDDWENLTYEEYEHRCEEDVKINTNLWHQQYYKLMELYGQDEDKVLRFLRFLMTKGKVYQEHLKNPFRLDISSCETGLQELEEMIEKASEKLREAMPKNPIKAKKSPPKNMYKQDGSLSAHGEKWHQFLLDQGLPSNFTGEVQYVKEYDTPKPTSVSQVKDWFFSLGWKPQIYNEAFNAKGELNRVPQIKDKEKNLCPSVLELAEREPAILEYEGLGIMLHRAGYLKGFLRDKDKDGNIVADIAGLTNTLRIRHRGLVNLPSSSARYGKYVRSCLLPPKGHIMIGSDLGGLESVTRNNFVIDIDPEFVSLQDHPYYDPHLEIAVIAGMMSQGEADFYKLWKAFRKDSDVSPEDITEDTADLYMILKSYELSDERDHLYHKLDRLRHQAKTTNYSAMYGVGATKLGKELKILRKDAELLIDAYWKKNWSVKYFSNRRKTKMIGDQMWVLNPLNDYWYSLRFEKDIFSTVNQSAGDYIFTMWQHFLLEMGVTLLGGFHDEIITSCLPKDEENVVSKLFEAIDKVNSCLGLKVPVGIDYKIGKNYAEVH